MTILNDEETGKQVFVISCDTLKQGFRILASFVKKLKNKYDTHKRDKAQVKNAVRVEKERIKLHEPYKGKQTVSQLMKQNQQLNSVDISTDKSLRLFNSIAKKHGVDFAVKKNPESGKFLIFFKAKDHDVLAAVYDEFAKKELNKNSKKQSLINKINEKEKAVKEMRKDLQLNAEKYDKNLSGKDLKNEERSL